MPHYLRLNEAEVKILVSLVGSNALPGDMLVLGSTKISLLSIRIFYNLRQIYLKYI